MPPGLTALELETDRALLQQIYEQYEPRMYRVALQVLKSSVLAEDAVHRTVNEEKEDKTEPSDGGIQLEL